MCFCSFWIATLLDYHNRNHAEQTKVAESSLLISFQMEKIHQTDAREKRAALLSDVGEVRVRDVSNDSHMNGRADKLLRFYFWGLCASCFAD